LADTGLACDFASEDRWVPDANAVCCMVSTCSTRFGFLQRRHHCRCCGHVVCGACSNHLAFDFDGPSDAAGRGRLQRICRECNDEMLSRLDAQPRTTLDVERWTHRFCMNTHTALERGLAEQQALSSAHEPAGGATILQARVQEPEQSWHSLQRVNMSGMGDGEVVDQAAQLAQAQEAVAETKCTELEHRIDLMQAADVSAMKEDAATEHAMGLSNIQSQLDQARVKDGQSHAAGAPGLSEVSTSKSALVPGATVEVWSNTESKWCPGNVLSVAENSVTLEYTRDVEGSSSKIVKALPIDHQDLRLALVPGATVEVWSNTNNKWCPGKVLSMAEHIVTLEYTRDVGGLSSKAVKALPIGHQDFCAEGQAE